MDDTPGLTQANRRILVAILLAFAFLGLLYCLATPIFEASDEVAHYPVVKHIADGRGLPSQDPGVETAWAQEGSQPPLYYALTAFATAWIDTSDFAELRQLNPLANIGKPLVPGNKNMVIHTSREAFPWRGTVLAVHLIRFLSLLLQANTVLFTYMIAKEISPERPDLAAGAAALVAFNPMFLFIAASVNNDNLIVPLATFTLWWLVRGLAANRFGDRDAVILGIVLGAAALTKLSGLALIPLSVGVLAVIAVRRRAGGSFLRWGAIAGLLTVAIAGWWYLRNWRLYGDPTGLSVMLAIAGRRPAPPSWSALLGEFTGFRMSYWGVFGAFTVVAQQWVYRFYDGLVLAAATGWILLTWRARKRLWTPQLLSIVPLVLWVVVVFISLVRWTSLTYASQGRLIFPAAGAVAVLLVYGLAGWLPRHWQGQGLAIVAAGMVILAAALPPWVIHPAYTKPPLLTADQVPPSAQRTDVVFAGTLHLLAYELPQDTVLPGERLPVTIYWETVGRTDKNYSVFVHLLGRHTKLAGQIGTYPGLGAYPTSLLRSGDIVRDTYHVPVEISATAPSLLRVDVGLYEYNIGDEIGLPAVDGNGQPASGVIGQVRLLPHKAPAYVISERKDIELGGQAMLVGHDSLPEVAQPGQTLTVTVYWQARARIAEDYQVFLHLVDSQGQNAAQGDQTPLGGDWPTWAWEPGQIVRDVYLLELPQALLPGTYQLRTGLYRLSDGMRVSVHGPPDQVQDAAILLGQIEVR